MIIPTPGEFKSTLTYGVFSASIPRVMTPDEKQDMLDLFKIISRWIERRPDVQPDKEDEEKPS